MTKATKRLARQFAKGRNRRTFFRYLLAYGWTEDEVNDMWEYATSLAVQGTKRK